MVVPGIRYAVSIVPISVAYHTEEKLSWLPFVGLDVFAASCLLVDVKPQTYAHKVDDEIKQLSIIYVVKIKVLSKLRGQKYWVPLLV